MGKTAGGKGKHGTGTRWENIAGKALKDWTTAIMRRDGVTREAAREKVLANINQNEYWVRVSTLINRGMGLKAAQTVVDAAMYGEGCIEGTVRVKIQAELDKEKI